MLVHEVCVVEEEEEHGAATDVVTLGNLVNRACGTQFDVLHVWMPRHILNRVTTRHGPTDNYILQVGMSHVSCGNSKWGSDKPRNREGEHELENHAASLSS